MGEFFPGRCMGRAGQTYVQKFVAKEQRLNI